MEHRPEIDTLAFAAAMAALGAATLAFAATLNGAAVIMCGLCLAGLLGGRLAGIPGRALLPVALGLVFLLWLVWVEPPAAARRTSAFAHAAGGALAGWAFAITLRPRLSWPAWGVVAITGIFALVFAWELGEWIGDRALDTALIPSKRDSALDVFFGGAGGAAAIAAVRWLAPRRADG